MEKGGALHRLRVLHGAHERRKLRADLRVCLARGSLRRGLVPDEGRVHVGRAGVLRRSEADVEIGAEPLGDVLAEVRPEALPAHSSHHLAHEEAEGEGVIAVPLARCPPGLLCGKCRAHPLPVVQRALRQRLSHGTQPRLVAQQPSHEQPVLASCGELGPVPRHGCLHVEKAAVDEMTRAERRRETRVTRAVNGHRSFPFLWLGRAF